MTIPMMVLAVGSAFLGLILGPTGIITSWLEPVFGSRPRRSTRSSPLMVIIGAHPGPGRRRRVLRLACCYGATSSRGRAPAGTSLTRAARNDLYQDAVNEGLFMRPGIHLTRALVFADARGVDGAAAASAALIAGTSARLRRLQNGYARSYALTMLVGVVIILGAVWVMQ